ncbi:hypothetical protein LJ739_16785 [Aestuariibacter halophilus]|uniref:Gamma-glutamylcyclotransferase n=1 Tax=Fluctibacter halophilus TaxID=226011 RepID=A0ABS8GFD3_9ALTE|nr:hypothetical protein [Aestuariibacter halophilus]MCC2617911.1 hypothetical protein [Aestuariibacter halophilus]
MSDFLLGYGSLLSHDSRTHYSALSDHAVAVNVKGWQRGWVTRSMTELQTYVGAWPVAHATLNAVLLPVDGFSADFRKREQDYTFEQVDPAQVSSAQPQDPLPVTLRDSRIWICHTRARQPANPDYPVSQSYVDTCLTGCLEVGGHDFAQAFIDTTHWQDVHWHWDRHEPIYPRRARNTQPHWQVIDALLKPNR